MNDAQVVTRRASVRTLALIGAAMASGAVVRTASAGQIAEEPGKTPPSPADAPAARAVDVAVARFAKGHSCAQAVFTAFAERMGVDYKTAMKIASGFGGGMYAGSVCGAVTGAYMALGVRFGDDPTAPMPKLVRELNERFKAKHASVNCSELLGFDLAKVDLADPAAVKALKEKVLREKNPYLFCGAFVRDAAEIVEAMTSAPRSGAAG